MASPQLRRPAALAAVVLAGALALAACGGSSDDAEPATVGEAATVESTTTVATTAPTTAAPAPAAPVGLFSPQESVQALYDAWKADDKATAATLAEPAAVDGQWFTAPGDYAIYNRCDSGEFGTSGCLFRGANGTIQYTAEQRGDRWVVVQAFYSAP